MNDANAHGEPIDGRWGGRDDDRVGGERRSDLQALREQRRIVAAALGGEAAELGVADLDEASPGAVIHLPDEPGGEAMIDLRSDDGDAAEEPKADKVRHYSLPTKTTDEVTMPDDGTTTESARPLLARSDSAGAEAAAEAPVTSETTQTISFSPLQEAPPPIVTPPVPPTDPDLLARLEPPEVPPSLLDDRSRVAGGGAAAPSRGRGRSAGILLVVALLLALLSGLLGALWQRERSTAEDLRAELASIEPTVDPASEAEIEDLRDQVNTLQLENERLAKELQDTVAQVPQVPEGRMSDIDTPFTPLYVDEVRGRFIAVSAQGDYVVWGGGVNDEITDSGTLGGIPTGLFAAREQAWVATDAGEIEVLSLVGADPDPTIASGSITSLVRDLRAFWGFNPDTNELKRFRQANGRVTSTIELPTPIRDLTVGAGAVWALGDDGLVYRVNTADFTVSPLIAGQEVVSIAAGPDALWALSAADGSLRRLDAVSGEVLVTVPVGRDPIDSVFSGNSVWVALRSGSTLIEVDTRTSAVVSRTSLPGVPTELSRAGTGVLVTLEGDSQMVRVASLTVEEELTSGAIDDAEVGDEAVEDEG